MKSHLDSVNDYGKEICLCIFICVCIFVLCIQNTEAKKRNLSLWIFGLHRRSLQRVRQTWRSWKKYKLQNLQMNSEKKHWREDLIYIYVHEIGSDQEEGATNVRSAQVSKCLPGGLLHLRSADFDPRKSVNLTWGWGHVPASPWWLPSQQAHHPPG